MSFIRFCKHFYLTNFSKPESDRAIYRSIKKNKQVRSIVEIGISDLNRTQRMLRLALDLAGEDEDVSYTGVDMFEGRESGDGVSLKETHRELNGPGRKIKLLPGDPYSALARGTNAMQNSDLLLISSDVDSDSLDRAWFYVPRMMHDSTMVFIEVAGEDVVLEHLSQADVDAICKSQDSARRAA